MIDNGEIWCKLSALVLLNGLYSLKNSHIPFGKGFQPPHPLTAEFRLNIHFIRWGFPIVGNSTFWRKYYKFCRWRKKLQISSVASIYQVHPSKLVQCINQLMRNKVAITSSTFNLIRIDDGNILWLQGNLNFCRKLSEQSNNLNI